MRIGELARRSGLAPSRIRFYEASGLLEGVRRQANGYRDYAPETLHALELIALAQQGGFSLEEIRRLLPAARSGQDNEAELLAGLRRKLDDIDTLQRRLAQTRERLQFAIDGIENRPLGMSCVESRERVMARLREAPEGGGFGQES